VPRRSRDRPIEAIPRRGRDATGRSGDRVRSTEVAVIERLARQDRTAVYPAVLAVAGMGAGEPRRRAVLAGVGQAADKATVGNAISRVRGAQIVRHVRRTLEDPDEPIGA